MASKKLSKKFVFVEGVSVLILGCSRKLVNGL